MNNFNADIDCKCVDVDAFNNMASSKENKLSFLTINVRGLRGKYQELLTYINSFNINFTFIILTEVWLSDDLNMGFNIPLYESIACLRKNRSGGGIMVYFSDQLNATVVEEKTGICLNCESLLLNCYIHGIGNIYVWAIYRPPNGSIDSFSTYLENNLSFFKDKRCILAGDFNLDIFKSNSAPSVMRYINLMQSYGYIMCISKATYLSPIRGELTSCLDQYWHNLRTCSKSFVVGPP